jgi:hypothetical protein
MPHKDHRVQRLECVTVDRSVFRQRAYYGGSVDEYSPY